MDDTRPRDSMTEVDARELSATAHALADAARDATLPLFRTSLQIANKDAAGFDPVTEADRAAEAAMRRVLSDRRPRDGIVGEELADTAGDSGLSWVIDPIDGTRAFMIGAPTWGTLIAAADSDGPLLGLIDQPWTGERWTGGLGVAALATPHGDAHLSTRATERLEDAVLCSTFPEVGTADERAAFDRVKARARMTRYGLDCYAYGLLAAGHVDLVIEAGLAPYDICAPIAVIEAAGGIVTDWQGGPAHAGGRVVAACNGTLHAEALRLLGGD